jgi:hypothetical protein
MFITFDTNSPYVRSSEDYIGNPNKLFTQLKQDNKDLRDSAQKNAQDGKLSTTKNDEIGGKY